MFHVIIPARYNSTRLPGKALADIHGKPMVYWVWRQALASNAESVVIATDDKRIAEAMLAHGAHVALTRSDHPSGTDRLAEVVNQYGWADDTIVVNLQGDEPLMPPENLDNVAALLLTDPEATIATLAEPITQADEYCDPAVVKVVCDQRGRALYFSRAAIPAQRDNDAVPGVLAGLARRHVGLYAYRCGFLRRFVAWPPALIEAAESLEQLRALYHGEVILVGEPRIQIPAGVDTPDDLARVRAVWNAVHAP